MAEEVEIIGVDGGPASEATLKKLLEVTKKSSPSGSGSKVQDNYNKALKNGVKVTKDFNKNTKEATESVEALGNAVPGFIKKLGLVAMAAGAAAGLVKNFSQELLVGGRNVEDFVKHMPIIGGLAADLTGMFTQATENLRQSADIGASFGNDIMGMTRAAAAAQMPLEEFSSLVANNTTTLRQLGSTSTNGALRLSQLTKSVRLGDEQLMNLAFSTEALNEGTASYIRLQAQSGRLQSMSDAELIAGTQGYLKEVDLLAKITGKSRKATQDDMEKTAAEANVLVMMQDMNDKEKKNFLGNITMVDELLGQDMGNAFKDLADGVAQTDLAKKLEALNSPLGNLARQARSGEISQGEFAEKLKTVGPELLSFAKSMGGAGTSALMTQSGFAEALGSLAQVTANAGRVGNAADALAEQLQGDKFSQSMLGFNQDIDSTRAKITEAFLTSNVFDKTKVVVGGAVDGLVKFNNYLADKSVVGLELFDKGLSKILENDYFKNLMDGKVAEIKEPKSSSRTRGPSNIVDAMESLPVEKQQAIKEYAAATSRGNNRGGRTGNSNSSAGGADNGLNSMKAAFDSFVNVQKESNQIQRETLAENKKLSRAATRGRSII
tara:strand:+ start:30770 stop:32593 length:1824 start_codon:yes stop_codon:yes gene_type:complete